MSMDDERGWGSDDPGNRSADAYSTLGGTRQTRTRMPGGGGDDGDAYGRRPARTSRSLIMAVGVVVLLIAAIAFANQGGGDSSGGGSEKKPQAGSNATAATGTKPVQGKTGSIASGFAHDQQGAQSAAANYAVALGSADMFNPDRRHAIVQAITDSSKIDELQAGFDADYSEEFAMQIGLSEDGVAPAGSTFVNRTLPAGTKVLNYSEATARIEVWCSGLFGLAGDSSTKPVTNGWFTVSFTLTWDGNDWKILDTGQKEGPTPVTGDNPVSGSTEIADAVTQFGGFTYAR
ncbi:hypothetical protein [Streptomyces sp. NPDC059166]|uniref:hypothetical protein n=1 Tax=Streptomyces sp. NPDC059166 TaxID=3346752 RepID=UPI0036B63850